MALPAAFDPLHHHIGLGADVANLKGYYVVGQYSKQLANPVLSKPSDIGTEDLVGQRSLSNLTQDDFSGGEGQEDWDDPAMFAECVGMLPDQLTRRIRTIRPLDAFLTSETQANITPVSFETVAGFLFMVFNNATPQGRVFRYNPATPGSSPQKETVAVANLSAGKLITAATWNRSSNRLWLGSNDGTAGVHMIHSYDWDQAAGAGFRLVHYGDYGTPSNTTVVTGLHIFGLLKFAITENNTGSFASDEDNSKVFLYVSGSGASAKWTVVGTLPGKLVKAVTYNNAVYMLSRNSIQQSYLSMTQGSQVFPVVEIPYAFRAQDMVEYAGRLYICGTGYDLDGNDKHGEIYEVNGASLRLVRTFSKYNNDADYGTQTGTSGVTTPGTEPIKRRMPLSRLATMCVAEGLLWMPDDSQLGLEAYDATTDAFFGGPRYRHGNDTAIQFTKMVPFADSIYLWGNGTTLARTGLYRTERKADSGELYQTRFMTSDIHPEPSQNKAWSRMVIHTMRVHPGLDYSLDSGETWTTVGAAMTTEAFGDRYVDTFDLSGINASKLIRFRIRFALTGAANEAAAYLIAWSLSFTTKGDTKRRWAMTVAAVDRIEDNTTKGYDQVPIDISTTLWTLKDQAAAVKFRDLDRVDYNVIITDIQDMHTPPDPHGERFVQLALLEL